MNKRLSALVLGAVCSVTSALAHADDLLQIYQLALTTDPQLQQAAASKEAAFSEISVSRARLLPQITGSANYQDTRSDLDAREAKGPAVSVDLRQSIYDRNSWVSLSQAEKSATRSDINYHVAQQDLMLRVAEAYFEVLSAKDSLEFTQAEKRAIERQLEQTKQRFNVGLTAITDVHEAQAEYDQVLADEITANNRLENSYEGLREITGHYHRDIATLNTKRFDPTDPDPQNTAAWQRTAERNNLSLLAQNITVEIANKDIDLAKAGHWPTLSLVANAASSDLDTNSGDYNSGTIGIQLDIPIYSGGGVSAQTQVARNNYVVASETLNQLHRSVLRNVINAYNNVRASISSIYAFQQTVVSRQSSLEATESGFEVGTRTVVDVLDSTRNLYSAKSQLSEARYNYILNVLRLKQAAGTLTDEDIVLINKSLSEPTANAAASSQGSH